MAQIVLNIPDEKVNEILDSFANIYGWTPGSGVTKVQFTKNKVIDFVKHVHKQNLANVLTTEMTLTISQTLSQVVIT